MLYAHPPQNGKGGPYNGYTPPPQLMYVTD